MQQTQILFFAMPRMLRELVRDSLADYGELSFAGCYATAAELEPALRELDGSRYVLIGTNGLESDTIRDLLGRHPRAKLLVLAGDGRETFLYELRPHRQPLGAVSPERLAAAVLEAS